MRSERRPGVRPLQSSGTDSVEHVNPGASGQGSDRASDEPAAAGAPSASTRPSNPYLDPRCARSFHEVGIAAPPVATHSAGTDVAVVVLRGELDAYNGPAVRSELADAIEAGSNVVLDLRAASF